MVRTTRPPSMTSASCRSSSTSTRLPPPGVRGVGRAALASAAFVCGPTIPSRLSPAHFWNATTANLVCSPATPSTAAAGR